MESEEKESSEGIGNLGRKEVSDGWKRAGRHRGSGGNAAFFGINFSIKVESKLFVLSFGERDNRWQGIIEERCKGFSSWVRLGPKGWEFLLEGLEFGVSRVSSMERTWVWEEGRRSYSLILSKNAGGCFLKLGVRDEGRKFFQIFMPKGGKMGEGWKAVASKIRQAGVGPMEGRKGLEEGCLVDGEGTQNKCAALKVVPRDEDGKLLTLMVDSQRVDRRLG